jgi:chromosome segregation ATPase
MMLDTIFGNGPERKHKQDELRSMMSQARQERAALRTMLEQAGGASEKLARTSQALDELSAKTDGMMRKVDKLASAAAGNDELRTKRLEQLEARVGELLGQVAEIKRVSSATSVPEEGQIQHRLAMEALAAQSSEAHASLQALRSSAVLEVQTKLESLAQLQDFGKDTEKRLASLNALAEHVSHKAKALETQKHTVEHAVVEATRLNEMVWNMDAQIAKLADGRDQMQRAEETVARMEQLARSTTQELAVATAAREQFVRESTQSEEQGR